MGWSPFLRLDPHWSLRSPTSEKGEEPVMPHNRGRVRRLGWQALNDEARRQGVTLEELVVHAAMYYLADADSERFSRRVLPSQEDAG